jgi:hypothetical protein
MHQSPREQAVYLLLIFFNNGAINGALTTAYNANGPPEANGSEAWKVYMVQWESLDDYAAANVDSSDLDTLKAIITEEHSSIDVATRSTSRVCCKHETEQCGLDPEVQRVQSVLGMGDTWASNCAQCPCPCATDYGVCARCCRPKPAWTLKAPSGIAARIRRTIAVVLLKMSCWRLVWLVSHCFSHIFS